jgi:hypothetical protein
MKRFFEWIGLKEKLHEAKHQPPLVSERDMWWASIGENVGSEINGKRAPLTGWASSLFASRFRGHPAHGREFEGAARTAFLAKCKREACGRRIGRQTA